MEIKDQLTKFVFDLIFTTVPPSQEKNPGHAASLLLYSASEAMSQVFIHLNQTI
jgi:hypothetical protein